MASKPNRDLASDLVATMGELARLIEQQSDLASQVRELTRMEKDLFRVRAKRIRLLLAALKGCENIGSPQPFSR